MDTFCLERFACIIYVCLFVHICRCIQQVHEFRMLVKQQHQ